MRELKEKWLKEFVSLGKEVEHEGNRIRPNTRTSVVIGKVYKLEEAGKNNLKCVVKVAGAKFDFSGFINENSPVTALLKQAKDKDVPICVRFERKRKKNANPLADIMDLTKDASTAKDNVVWITAGVYNYGDSSWILSDDAVSNPAEDPSYVKSEIENSSYSTEGFFEAPKAKLKTTDKDWKISHLVSMYTYASEHNIDNEIGLNQEELKIVSIYMLKACDQLQMKTKQIQEPNYNDYSHTKARGMLFSWMRVNPLSREIMDQKGGFTSWISKFLNDSLGIWAWATEQADKD